ncbi:ABC transporter permease [Enterococcus columbae]|uniref:Putative hemin transport system permease protein HrtB n=1 Tax=Enterococcus columbae DSM 7374 = ATCC 51263 TaxID=1121865 RepID=S0K3F7_9ENTE|nr:ABC transporter permease [Enterococcus columbae]EOT39072.1 hypothetical protein OMW_01949 [Enterococcus columbae DSM 7374 = ATCC 51263]EOW79995.1 hypothetical protein I568_02346 [Enterococcus columbae DSM 7374 = ATCC 51263]OJG23976.1 hypothetical protein RR47_GL000385 [Enterococcus columbae DSM 7374 = ATCC 51263]
MFLAISEMKHAKLRYALVIGVVFLIAYLVFFLTGLAYGLAQANRSGVDKWQARYILLADEANLTLNRSVLSMKQADAVKAEEKALLGQFNGVVYAKDQPKATKVDVSFFGIQADAFLKPEIEQGRMFTKDNEVVADESLKKQYGLAIGDHLVISGSPQAVKIVGFTKQATFNVAPILYMNFATYEKLRFGQADAKQALPINAVVIRGKVNSYPKQLEKIAIPTFIQELPGYRAQNLTFGFMIGFLIVIAAIVIGIFIYILTMQKKAIFGVMKAQGIASFYIGKSVLVQTSILAFLGIVLGLVSTYASSFVLPKAVPFLIHWPFYLVVGLGMLLIASVSALFSVATIVRIDPLKAIS